MNFADATYVYRDVNPHFISFYRCEFLPNNNLKLYKTNWKLNLKRNYFKLRCKLKRNNFIGQTGCFHGWQIEFYYVSLRQQKPGELAPNTKSPRARAQLHLPVLYIYNYRNSITLGLITPDDGPASIDIAGGLQYDLHGTIAPYLR